VGDGWRLAVRSDHADDEDAIIGFMSLEIAFDYRQFCWFQPLIGDYIDLQMGTADLKQPLPISRCRRALWIPTIMWGGPIRFRLLVDVEESRAVHHGGLQGIDAACRPAHHRCGQPRVEASVGDEAESRRAK